MKDPAKGYRRINDDLYRRHNIKINDKRALRICRVRSIKSTIKYANHGCTRQADEWLTDVTEFKWYDENKDKHKVYLSAILDLYDRRIVSYVIGDHNDNPLVFTTFDQAIAANPGAMPLCHSDRGFQYTNRTFHTKLENAGMTQSMSRVAKCIDNGPMEGFWGILKRERYYGKRFNSRKELVAMIEDYIYYYNNERYQRRFGVLTPIEKHNSYLLAA